MTSDDSWRPTLKQSCELALAMGLVFFARDWSGYNPREPDIFFWRPLREVWWHLPVAVAGSFVVVQLARLYDWIKERSWPYWVAYVVVLIAVVIFGVWLVFQVLLGL